MDQIVLPAIQKITEISDPTAKEIYRIITMTCVAQCTSLIHFPNVTFDTSSLTALKSNAITNELLIILEQSVFSKKIIQSFAGSSLTEQNKIIKV
jgi:hypothetical protein